MRLNEKRKLRVVNSFLKRGAVQNTVMIFGNRIILKALLVNSFKTRIIKIKKNMGR